MNLHTSMGLLQVIEKRVRPTICDTLNTSTGAETREGRISEKDLDILLLIAKSLSSVPPNMMGDIEEFHRKFEIEYEGKPRSLDLLLQEFRLDFMREELSEYHYSIEELSRELSYNKPDPGEILIHLEGALDALVDLVYVTLGTAYLHGFNFNEAWRRVHAANMMKIRAPSARASKESSGRGHVADVIKPQGWIPPSHTDLIEDHAHLPPPQLAESLGVSHEEEENND